MHEFVRNTRIIAELQADGAMLSEQVTHDDIAKVMGGNLSRLMNVA